MLSLHIKICFLFGILLVGAYILFTDSRSYNKITELWSWKRIYRKISFSHSTDMTFSRDLLNETLVHEDIIGRMGLKIPEESVTEKPSSSSTKYTTKVATEKQTKISSTSKQTLTTVPEFSKRNNQTDKPESITISTDTKRTGTTEKQTKNLSTPKQTPTTVPKFSKQKKQTDKPKTIAISTETKWTEKPSKIKWIDMEESRKYSNYGDGTCPENENTGLLTEILQRWDKIASELKITYFYTCGTLLGAWRDGQLVPKDTDLDVLISRSDATKLETIRQKKNFDNYDGAFHLYMHRDWRNSYDGRRRFKCNGKQVERYSDQCSFQEPLGRLMKDGSHLDIYDYTIKNGLLIDPSEGYHEMKLKDVFPLKKCKFLGVTGLCPNNPKNFLHSFYDNLEPNKKCANGEWARSFRNMI